MTTAQTTTTQKGKTSMRIIDDIYVDGSFVSSLGTGHIDVINPSTREVIARVPDGVAADTEKAIAAAAAAFDGWASLTGQMRGEYLQRIQEGLAQRREEIAETVSREVGMPYHIALDWQAGLPIDNFGYYAKLAAERDWIQGPVRHSLVVQEPVGVVGAITPWNYPLHQIALKVAPALAAGCTVVLKPSEVAPLTGHLLAEVAHQAGLPSGVLNVVSGRGPEVGEPLAISPDVDMVSFTGSTRAGRRVGEIAARTVKRVALELGGKSANLILEGSDLEAAVADGVANSVFNSGQTCTALTRMIVPRSQLAEVEELAGKAAGGVRVGDPFDEQTELGPVVSEVQYERVQEYIAAGRKEGAKVVTGDLPVPENGYFVSPTVFSEVDRGMRIAREEIFGPVLSILAYDTLEEGIEIANDSEYGLAGGVWAKDLDTAISVARRLRTGQVSVNGGGFNVRAPIGGYKQSGNGREAGENGLEEYLETKAIHGAVGQ